MEGPVALPLQAELRWLTTTPWLARLRWKRITRSAGSTGQRFPFLQKRVIRRGFPIAPLRNAFKRVISKVESVEEETQQYIVPILSDLWLGCVGFRVPSFVQSGEYRFRRISRTPQNFGGVLFAISQVEHRKT